MASPLPILVVGGDGLVGRRLVAELRRLGRTVVATSRRAGTGDVRLDLADPASWPDLPPVSAAVFVAAVARLG
ncbi:MAG TPA: NAD-dependent epimerase/dehydratase family protein, partial [Candidatus Sulfotelmatobacter sp.]|nr:NAD-dependent epimerase/dehydratase family protein [Candidatus Sulfotelmatobacter sp.]